MRCACNSKLYCAGSVRTGKSIRTVTMRMRYNDMEQITRSISMDEPTDLENDCYPLLPVLLNRAWERRGSVRLSKVYESVFSAHLALA